jgi:DNA-binding transcriptional LysR family regulator
MKPIDLTRFDLNLLVVMEALMAERHVGRAAERLHLSQSATSHALSRLRTALDDPLFIRNPKGIEPTPLAIELAPRVATILEEIARVASPRGPFDPRKLKRTFNIGATDYAVVTVMARASAPIHAAAPGVVLHLAPTDRESAVQGLDSGELDLAIGPGTSANLPQRVKRITLFEERFVGIARRGHPNLTKRGKAHAMDLEAFVHSAHVLVSPKGDARGAVDVSLEKLGHRRRIVAMCPNFLAVPFVVGAGDLIAVIAERVAQRLAPAADLVCFELPFEVASWTVNLGFAAARSREPELAWLVDTIVAATRG